MLNMRGADNGDETQTEAQAAETVTWTLTRTYTIVGISANAVNTSTVERRSLLLGRTRLTLSDGIDSLDIELVGDDLPLGTEVRVTFTVD